MQEVDFKGALSNVEEGQLDVPTMRAIHLALKIADKLMQDPSPEMTDAGIEVWDSSRFAVVTQYKAMRDQMLKEIEDV